MIHVLLTCAGRRNYLVDYFRRALAGRGLVFACDADASASALQEADRSFVLPPLTDRHYLANLLGICREYRIRLLLSLNDLELPQLARNRDRFREVGTIAVVSSPQVVDLCFDKLSSARFIEKIGLRTPRTFSRLEEARAALARGELTFPLVIKPRWGSASFGIECPESVEEMALTWNLGGLRLHRSYLASAGAAGDCGLIAQEKLVGIEYGLDVVNDLDGKYVATFVKQKLAMRAGETDKAVTVGNPLLESIGRRIGESLGHVGNLDCDVFTDGDQCWVLEMNPRFGGGYPFTHCAGADLPAVLIAWAQGAPPDPRWLSVMPGVASAKCDRLVGVNAEKVLRSWPGQVQCDPVTAGNAKEPACGP